MRVTFEALAVIASLAVSACAGGAAASRTDDPAMRAMRIAVSPEVSVSSPELKEEAALLRAGLEKDLRERGFALAESGQRPDGVLQLSLERPGPDRWEAKLDLDLPSGAQVDIVSVKRANLPLPQTDQDILKVADRLVVKLEGSWRVREYATTGVIWGGE